MREYAFRIVNVFAGQTLGGNPLCVFENASGMSDEEMQALALQFNLSETSFILPSEVATARMRIFTPDMEMAFAGHPSLGSAHVISALNQGLGQLDLECRGGIIPLVFNDSRWTLTTPAKPGPHVQACQLTMAGVAAMLGLAEEDILSEPVWVNTGSEQLLVPLKSSAAVWRAQPDAAKLSDWPANQLGRKSAYVFAADAAHDDGTGRLGIKARYFFATKGGSFAEDPGTGSACANLGAWWIEQGHALPASLMVSQGEQVRRPCQLYLDVDLNKKIHVGGKVIEIAQGKLQI
ncbi:PhzF family phenazine biosynthesis protein [Undibacterium sp. TS12]|uniref:PhzF family phenazine biosynthesis protein n=1 Tax=Undibacterium sp. TS12 TaxID=2908202 RepID=UPI001F4D27A7|nr:PhzF family phenazine biosynthesis protein [Undibacterium sp. TS12]MCH8619003.1 PhzF family phenazine biosynthesis protein [Undibacterium sp. TS12]